MDTLIYDGDCAFCLRCVQWIQKHFKRVPHIVAWQKADLGTLGLTAEQCQTALQWVSADSSRILSAHKARLVTKSQSSGATKGAVTGIGADMADGLGEATPLAALEASGEIGTAVGDFLASFLG